MCKAHTLRTAERNQDLINVYDLEDSIITMPILPRFIYRFNVIAIKILAGFFYFFGETDKLILKFTWKCKLPRLAKRILRKNKCTRFMLSDFKTYSREFSGSPGVRTLSFHHRRHGFDPLSGK